MIALVRTRTLRALRTDLAEVKSTAETEAEQHRLSTALATDSAIRAEDTIETLRQALARAQTDAAGARGEAAVLAAQHLLDAEDRVTLRMLLRAARRQSGRADRVYVLFRYGRLHGVYTTQDAAELGAEAEGAPRSGWTDHAPGAAVPPACETQWRIQPLPLGGEEW
ncbi:hypothetical protein OG285_17705 [Streptomyces sp. NBC_01471]|uniref:hypothetical protein n=1 Tax=Streptomyces sp. NBC_01471 TaxID=2903879 RepID=UPI003253DA24